MSRIVAAVALATAIALPLDSSASGYDKTTWGMSFAQVQKLYPGGRKETTQGGDIHYAVVRKVATLDALVAFSFTESGLSFVAVRFPAPGTSVVTKGRIGYMRPTKAQAGHIETIVRAALEDKYGQPKQTRAMLNAMGAPPVLDDIRAV
jgi:hypothetical protein